MINTCTVGSEHGMLNSWVAVPSMDLEPPAVINSTSLLIAEICLLRHLFPRKWGIMCFEFAGSMIFSKTGSLVFIIYIVTLILEHFQLQIAIPVFSFKGCICSEHVQPSQPSVLILYDIFTFKREDGKQTWDVGQMDASKLRVMMQNMFCNFCNLQDQGHAVFMVISTWGELEPERERK